MVSINGHKFGKKGIKDAAGNYYPCFYNFGVNLDGKNFLTIYARCIIKGLPSSLRPVNNSDGMTDYFECDRVQFPVGSPEYSAIQGFLK
jgi:hypothetical protein